jgi:hypothetical protein
VLSTSLSPFLAETSVTGLLVVPVLVDGAPKFSAPCRLISCWDLPVKESYLLESLREFLFPPLMPIYGLMSKGNLKSHHS